MRMIPQTGGFRLLYRPTRTHGHADVTGWRYLRRSPDLRPQSGTKLSKKSDYAQHKQFDQPTITVGPSWTPSPSTRTRPRPCHELLNPSLWWKRPVSCFLYTFSPLSTILKICNLFISLSYIFIFVSSCLKFNIYFFLFFLFFVGLTLDIYRYVPMKLNVDHGDFILYYEEVYV